MATGARFADGPQHLGQGVAARPAPQAAPERRAGFEVIRAAPEPVGGTPRGGVGFEHQHLQSMACSDGAGAESAEAAAHDDQIGHHTPVGSLAERGSRFVAPPWEPHPRMLSGSLRIAPLPPVMPVARVQVFARRGGRHDRELLCFLIDGKTGLTARRGPAR